MWRVALQCRSLDVEEAGKMRCKVTQLDCRMRKRNAYCRFGWRGSSAGQSGRSIGCRVRSVKFKRGREGGREKVTLRSAR